MGAFAIHGPALFALTTAGCSLLLAHDPGQCQRDADCAALGLQETSCDTANKVCKSSLEHGAAGNSANGGLSGVAGVPTVSGGGAAQGGNAGPAGAGGSTNVGGSSNAGALGGEVGGSSNEGGSAGSEVVGVGGGIDVPVPDWPTLAKPASGVRVRVRNFCGGSLWLHVSNGQNTFAPDEHELGNGEEQDYAVPADWGGGRITAYGTGPGTGELEKVSLSVTQGVSYYSADYIDGLGLPVEAAGFGGTCTVDQTQGCYAHRSDVASCPGFLKQGGRCLSAGTYCLMTVNQGSAYCHELDSAISSCSGCPGGRTSEVYSGTGPYAGVGAARLGAALNRGTTAQPDDPDSSKFYEQPPYNSYAKWARGLCPNMLAFAHDDYNSTRSYFPSCTATELRITFCPAR